jgi:DNA-binding response OmpR family regulator
MSNDAQNALTVLVRFILILSSAFCCATNAKPLTSKAFEMLLMLVERAGHVVEKKN